MVRLNAHARIEVALAAVLLLGSCGSDASRRFTEGDYDKIDAADVNARNALNRIAALESRLEEVEQEAELATRNVDTLFENAKADRETANRNAEVFNNAKDHILSSLGRVEARLGM